MPGFTSLFQVNLYPSFGRFDYITAEVDVEGVLINQVVEVLNAEKNQEFSWFEYYTKNQTELFGVRGIKTTAKYSYKDKNLDPSRQYGYNGTLFFALTADTELSSNIISITIKGYENSSNEVLFSETASLRVEARPNVEISELEQKEVMFGDVLNLNISTSNIDGDFTASLKVKGQLNEYLNVLGQISNTKEGYKLIINDSAYVYSLFNKFMYKTFELTITVSKVINGILVTDEDKIEFILVPFRITDIDLSVENVDKVGYRVTLDYYQVYNLNIGVGAEYSLGYEAWL